MIYDKDADLSKLDGKTVAILGYGSQGHAHALNLKDSGVDVIVGLRDGSASADKARADGLRVLSVADAASEGDIVMVAAARREAGRGLGVGDRGRDRAGQPAAVRPRVLDPLRADRPEPGGRRRHGRSQGPGPPGAAPVRGGQRRARADRGPPRRQRRARELVLAYARGIGCTRAGVIETSFKDETETDLFGEQAVLCGGVTELVRAGYETLVEAGYDPRLAYFECLHELKLIVDLMYEKGITGMRYSISNTAEYGDLTRGAPHHGGADA